MVVFFMNKSIPFLLIGVLIGFTSTIAIFSFENQLPTGFLVVNEGSTTSVGEQTQSNPNFGAIKGTIVYTITDPDTNAIISREAAADQTIYLVPAGKTVDNWDLVKASSDDYDGQLTGLDVDADSSTCSTSDYTTLKKYYDKDDDGEQGNENSDECDVYIVNSDSNGCFAMKIPPAEYDIYT